MQSFIQVSKSNACAEDKRARCLQSTLIEKQQMLRIIN